MMVAAAASSIVAGAMPRTVGQAVVQLGVDVGGADDLAGQPCPHARPRSSRSAAMTATDDGPPSASAA
jgi:hypothetical protein